MYICGAILIGMTKRGLSVRAHEQPWKGRTLGQPYFGIVHTVTQYVCTCLEKNIYIKLILR